jgi:hypothetical protein
MSTESRLPKLLTIRQLAERLFPGVDPPPLWTVRNIAKRGCPHLFLGNKLFCTLTNPFVDNFWREAGPSVGGPRLSHEARTVALDSDARLVIPDAVGPGAGRAASQVTKHLA